MQKPVIKVVIDDEVLPSSSPTQQVATKTQGCLSLMGKALGSKCDLNFPNKSLTMIGFDVTTKDDSSLLNRVLSNVLNNIDEHVVTIPKELFNRFYSKTNEPSSITKVVDDKAKDKIQNKKPSKPSKPSKCFN